MTHQLQLIDVSYIVYRFCATFLFEKHVKCLQREATSEGESMKSEREKHIEREGNNSEQKLSQTYIERERGPTGQNKP